MPWIERKTCRVIEPATPPTFLGSEASVLTGVLTSTNGLATVIIDFKPTVEDLDESRETIEPNKWTGVDENDISMFNMYSL